MSGSRARLAFAGGVFVAALGAGGLVIGRGFTVEEKVGAGAKLFDQVLEAVRTKYVDSVGATELYMLATAGLVYELGDPHSVFLDSARLARVQASISGLFGSLGLDVDVRDGWVSVVAALTGTPAEQAGLRAGDRLLVIDKRSTRDWTVEEARRALRGNPGTSVTLLVERPGVAGRTEIVVEREPVYVRPVQRAMIVEPGIGYLSLRTFSDSAAIEINAAIDSLHHAGARALILDLRGNPGGIVDQGTAVADLFLDPGQTIVSLRGRDAEENRRIVSTQPQRWPDMRVAVLVDRGTASASEIVAGALQDHDRALIVGRRTYGKGSAQRLFSFREPAGLKLTTSRWYTPSGRNIDLLFAAQSVDSALNDDTVRVPVFTTGLGRKVLGGGGIVPDVVAGDSITPPAYRALFAAIGRNMRKYRDVQGQVARAMVARGLGGPGFDVDAASREDLYARLARAGIRVERRVFDGASEWVDRQLGADATRRAYGRTAEEKRLVTRDKVVQEAAARLRGAKSPRDLVGKLP